MHTNNGQCPACAKITQTFPNFDQNLLNWFILMQAKFPAFHLAETGRGRARQEEMFNSGRSRAHYGESSHNYNCAMDTFFLINGVYNLDEANFLPVYTEMPDLIEWYGAPGAKFFERPHFEKKGWRDLRAGGLIQLVEP